MPLYTRTVALTAVVSILCSAQQKGVRLVGSAQPDATSLESIVQGVTRGAANDREKALALHRFGMEHLIHFIGPVEQEAVPVTDPLKLIGVYGYALCGNNSSVMAALYNMAGMKTRVRRFKYHEVPEVWFEGKWNYIDTDMFGYVFLADGQSIASIDEIIADPDLFVKQKNPPSPFFPYDRKEDMADVFRHKENQKDYHPYSNSHLMELGLRTGESVTMFFKPQDRFVLGRAMLHDLGTEYLDYWTLGPVRNGSLAWRDNGPAAYGNARFDYAPDLSSNAFLSEATSLSGIHSGSLKGKPALMASAPGAEASLVLEANTPWVIAGLQNDLSDPGDDQEGAIVSGYFWRGSDSDINRIALSVDHGRTWQDMWTNRLLGAVPFRVDLTRWVTGESGYQVKFTWVDRSGSAGISQLHLETWVELSPMALPRLVPGENTFTLNAAPQSVHYERSLWDRGRNLPGETFINLAAQEEPPYRKIVDSTKPGELLFDLGTDLPVKETRISILARAAGSAPKVTLSASPDYGKTWRVAREFKPHPEHELPTMWFNHSLAGATKLKVAVQDAGIDQILATSLVADSPKNPGPLRITHNWTEGDRRQSFSQTFAPSELPAQYRIGAAAGLVNESIRIEATKR